MQQVCVKFQFSLMRCLKYLPDVYMPDADAPRISDPSFAL